LLAGATPAIATTQAGCTFGPLIEHWDGTAWTQVPIAGSGELSSVAPVSATDVWAFGAQGIAKPIAEHWDGSSWQQVPLAKPKGATEVDPAGMSVRSATDIWAVGAWAGKGSYRTLVEHWNGTAWKVVPSPSAPDGSRLSGVTAVSRKNAWAVGESFGLTSHRSDVTKTLVLHWNGRAWKKVPSPNPSEANQRHSRHDDSLADVDAVSARNIWAVGTYFRRARNGHHSYQTLVLHWNGKSWKHVPSPSPGGIRHVNVLEGVAVSSAHDVWAVGGYRSTSGQGRLLAERRQGGSWKAVPVPPPPAPADDVPALRTVAPLSVGDVWASGSYLDDDLLAEQPLVAHWDGSAWTLVPTPTVGTESWLPGLAAVSSTDVWAVGGWDSC
jgi:hypothetical protein